MFDAEAGEDLLGDSQAKEKRKRAVWMWGEEETRMQGRVWREGVEGREAGKEREVVIERVWGGRCAEK